MMAFNCIVSLIVLLVYSISYTEAKPTCNHHDEDKIRSSNSDTESSNLRDSVNFSELMSLCNESFRISLDYLQEFNNSGSIPDESDKTPMCFMRCVLERAGILKDGVIIKSKVTDLLWPATGDSVEVCQSEGDRENHPCQKAYIIARCMMTRSLVDGKNKTPDK